METSTSASKSASDQQLTANDFRDTGKSLAETVIGMGKKYPLIQVAEGYTIDQVTGMMEQHARDGIASLELNYSEWAVLLECSRWLQHLKKK